MPRYWKNLKLKRGAVKEDVTLFGRYARGDFGYHYLKVKFMNNNGIEELSDEDFIYWFEGLGWHIREKKEDLLKMGDPVECKVRCEGCKYGQMQDEKKRMATVRSYIQEHGARRFLPIRRGEMR